MNTSRDHEFDNMFKRNFTMLIKQQIEEQRKVLEVRAVEKIAKYIREITKHPGFKYNTEEIIQLTQNLSRFTVSRTRDFDDIDNLMDNTESWLRKIVENVLHGENHYKKYDMDQRKQLVNNIINTYVRLRKISHVINDIVIEFDPHRANRFLEWIIYLGSKREIQNESSGSEVISYRRYLYQNFSEAELMLLHMYLGEKYSEPEYARSLRNYYEPKGLDLIHLMTQIKLNPISTILVKLVYMERRQIDSNTWNHIIQDSEISKVWNSMENIILKNSDMINNQLLQKMLEYIRSLRRKFSELDRDRN